MEVSTLKLESVWDECVRRYDKANIGYCSYVLICLLIGGVGVWSPAAFDISVEQRTHLFSLLTFGFAITGGMLLDVILNRARNIELTIVGVLVVSFGLVLLLSQFFRAGPYPALIYTGSGLIIAVWFLANVEDYESKVKEDPNSALGGNIDNEIGGGGLEDDE